MFSGDRITLVLGGILHWIFQRTSKRVQEQFPDAYEHIKEYEESGKTVIALPIDDILSTINKYKS